jgi:5-methylcytosine-specific restriction endonuclease McrBC regulatory subunit McrC
MSEAGIKLRGALAFPEQILVRTMAPSYFATRYTELSQDNPYNRVLAAAATVVSQSFREDLRLGALIIMAALKSKPAFDALLDDRSRARRMQLPDTHLAALTLAELILESRAAAFFVGDVTLGAQLIASDRLWEQGVTSIAMRAAVTKLSAQPRGNFAFRRLSGGGRAYELELIPDMLGTNGDIVVVDAKWKLLDPVTPQAATDDLHQALAYARHYAAKRIVLLYPSFQSSASSSGPFARLTTTAPPTVEVSLWLLPMLDTPGQMFEAISSALKAA